MNNALVSNSNAANRNIVDWFVIFYIFILLTFITIAPHLFSSNWVSSSDFHACIEISSSFIAIIAAIACLMYYFGLKRRYFLIVGIGFFISGSEDLLHGFFSFKRLFEGSGVDFTRFIPGTYVAGRSLLAISIITAVLLEQKLKTTENLKREATVFSIIGILLGGGVTALAFIVPLPKFIYPDNLISRPIDFISAMLFMIAFGLMMKRYLLKRDIFSGMLLACILFNICGQVYMSFSKQLFDIFFDTAHWANILSYCMPVIGITIQLLQEMKISNKEFLERKQAGEELKKTKDHLDNIIESSLDSIMVSDSVGYVTRVNKYFLENFGYREEEVLGKHTMDFTPMNKEGTYESSTGELIHVGKEYNDNAHAVVYKFLEEGKAENWEDYYFNKDGKLVSVEQNIVCLYNDDGERSGAVAIIRDITERKRTDGELKKTKDHLDNIIESSLDGIIVGDSTGNIVRVNKSFLALIGYPIEEVLGKHIMELSITEPGTYESTTGEMVEIGEEFFSDAKKMIYEKLFKEGKITNWETYYLRKDRGIVPVEQNISYLYSEEGDIIGSVGINRDVTERKKAEKEVMESRGKLLQSEKLKSLGELAGGVAHDFNNVLASILGRAQLLKMAIEPPQGQEERRKSMIELKEGLDVIEQASRDGAETVRRIQEFARRREEDKQFTTINLNEIIENAFEFTKVRWKDDAESKGIKIIIQKEFSTLPTTSGSAAELREVFTNLINNAVDAMPNGGNIRIKAFKEDSHIAIKVEDTGIGIANVRKDRIFDPFFTTKGVQSSGLGLSVSYGIIHRHRGTITVDSVEGKGTTFIIKLPISEKAVKEEKEEPTSDEQKKARILVVEDEENVSDLLSAILTEGGHEVETASDGSKGIKLFTKKEFDLVFTDLGMPGMSGWQVAEKIKSINKNVPVALITGWNVEQKESEMKESGVDLIAYKPFEVKQVFKLVQEGMILKDRFKAA